MELLLNLVWVMVSVTLIVGGLALHRRRPGSVVSPVVVLCALVLVAIFLFPAISVTDDLNPAIFAVEDSARRNHFGLILHATAQPVNLPLGYLTALLAPNLLCTARQRVLSERLPNLPVVESCIVGRAPPARV